MNDRSTLEPLETIETMEYIGESIFWGFISMIWYNSLLFRSLPDMTYKTSRFVLWGMLLASIVVCSVWLFRKERTGWNVFVSLALPYGIYTVWAYWSTFQIGIVIVLLISTVLSILFGILVMMRRIHRRKSIRSVIVRRIHKCISATGSIFSIAMVLIMAPLLLQGVFGVAIFTSNVKADVGTKVEEQTISGNIDTILKLQEEEWCALSTNDKLDVLQCVANIEAYYLGLSNELNVCSANLSEDTLGCYSDTTHTIYIDLDHLENDSVEAVLNSCCHEAYHSYQHRLVDAYNEASEETRQLRIYRSVAQYADEFVNYTDGNGDFSSYYSQQCETDARAYAEAAVEDYYSSIDEYLEGGLE